MQVIYIAIGYDLLPGEGEETFTTAGDTDRITAAAAALAPLRTCTRTGLR